MRLSCFLPGKRPGTHCTGAWVGLEVGLYGCRKISLGFEPWTLQPLGSCCNSHSHSHPLLIFLLFYLGALSYYFLLAHLAWKRRSQVTQRTVRMWKDNNKPQLSYRISSLNVIYRKNGLFTVPVYQALYQKECRLQGEPHVYKGVLRGMRWLCDTCWKETASLWTLWTHALLRGSWNVSV